MTVKDLSPNVTIKFRFDLSSFKLISEGAGCYTLATFNDEILYIGLAKNLKSRFLQHLDNKEKVNPTLEGKAIWFYYLEYDPTNLEKLERTWLNQYINKHGRLPIFNKNSSPIY